MSKMRLAGAAVVALLVVFGIGWLWGRSGRAELQTGHDAASLRLQLFEARSALQEARLELYSNNFGNASRHIEAAKAPLGGALERVREDNADATRALEECLRLAGDAQQLANKLDQTSNQRVGDAVKQLDAALAAVPPVPPAQ
jgi:hypothetical protein